MGDQGIFLHSLLVFATIEVFTKFYKVFLEAMASQGDPAGPALMEPISAEPGRGHIYGRHGCKVGKP